MTLSIATAHALANPVIGLPRMAAIIIDGRSVVSRGHNSRKTHPLAAKYSANGKGLCIHAEIAAIVAAKGSVEGMDMYVARVFRDGRTALARPCAGCFRAIVAFGIRNVEWTQ